LDGFKRERLKYEERSIKEMEKEKADYCLSDCEETERERERGRGRDLCIKKGNCKRKFESIFSIVSIRNHIMHFASLSSSSQPTFFRQNFYVTQ
jgi:hypothetical protein